METKHATSTMPCELYEAEYVTSMTPRCMVKDLVKNRLSKGQTFDEGCWKAFNCLSPQEQLSAVNALRRARLEALVNPSAYFQKLIDNLRYFKSRQKGGSTSLTSNCNPPEVYHSLQMQEISPDKNGTTSICTAPSLWADPQAAKVTPLRGKRPWTGGEVLASAVHSGLISDCLDKMCLEFFGDLTEAQQLQAANEFRRRVTPMIRNPSALLTSIITRVQGGSSGISGATRIASQPAKSPFLAAKPKRSLNAQHFPEALFLENFSSECRRAYERLPSEAQYRLKQRCAEDKAARTRPEAFQRALYSITGQGGPQQAHTEGMNGKGKDELIPAYHPDGEMQIEAQDEPDAPHMPLQAWPADAPEIQPMVDPPTPWVFDQAPSQQGGPGSSAAGAQELAGTPPTTEAIESAAQELMGLLLS